MRRSVTTRRAPELAHEQLEVGLRRVGISFSVKAGKMDGIAPMRSPAQEGVDGIEAGPCAR